MKEKILRTRLDIPIPLAHKIDNCRILEAIDVQIVQGNDTKPSRIQVIEGAVRDYQNKLNHRLRNFHKLTTQQIKEAAPVDRRYITPAFDRATTTAKHINTSTDRTG